ncbi:hypothetical protein D3C76_650150 [compost metagenome]
MGHVQADLADEQAHQQRAGDRTEVEAAQPDPADQHAQRYRQEHRDLRVGAQRAEDEIDHCRSSPGSGRFAGSVNQRSLGTHFSCSGSPR